MLEQGGDVLGVVFGPLYNGPIQEPMTVESNLEEMERGRETYWLRYPATSPLKLRWRAIAVRHCFHILPGETILELGAGSGLWTEHLTGVLKGGNPITAVVFNDHLARAARQKNLSNVEVVLTNDLASQFAPESFNYIIGTAILCHSAYADNLRLLRRLLKPGGQLLFFEANHWNPQVFLKNVVPALGRWAGHARCQVSMRKYQLVQVAAQQGFTDIEVVPFDIVHPRAPRSLIRALQSLSYIVEHAPLIKETCGTLYIWARKPGAKEARAGLDLCEHPQLFDSTSVVIPCHNEEMNIPRLVRGLLDMYGRYIHEIILVNDNSQDRTAEVAAEMARLDSRVRLINRNPPNGVGLALSDGYRAAAGRYILSMDSDFLLILPELRDLFDAIARGRDGAIGSRFSYDSMLINYPFAKILANRAFHALANLVLGLRVRDLTNNLKLFRADILKDLQIEQHHFAANAETGLKPVLAGYDIEEVPISWIDRTSDMGTSTFRVIKVAPGYCVALARMIWRGRRKKADQGSASVVARPGS
jgi:dolichol-phosphate mannosyltransferase